MGEMCALHVVGWMDKRKLIYVSVSFVTLKSDQSGSNKILSELKRVLE